MMLFKKTKNLLAALLCLCMVVAVIPVAAPSAAALEENDLFFNFASSGGRDVTLDKVGYEHTNNTWKFYGYSASTWGTEANFAWDNLLSKWNSGLQLYLRTAADNRWAAVELNVTMSGKFNISLDYTRANNGGYCDIYLIPASSLADNSEASVTAALTSANQLASVHGYYAPDGYNPIGTNYEVKEPGKYILVFKGASTAMSHPFFFPKSLTFENLAAPVLPVDNMSVDFGNGKFVAKCNVKETDANCFYRYMQAPSNNEKTLDSFVLTENIGLPGANLTLDLGVITGSKLAAGTYDVTIRYAQNPTSGIADIYLVPFEKFYDNWPNDGANIIKGVSPLGKVAPIGRVSFGGATSKDASVTFKGKTLAEGNYIMIINVVGAALEPIEPGYHTVCIEGIDIAPASSAAEAKDAIFGDTYAYVKSTGGSYAIDFIGAVKATDGYKEVGFEVWADGAYVGDAVTSNVYNSITVNGEAKTAASYGGEYVFVANKADISASAAKIIVRPFVKDENDAKIYHGNKTFAVSLS